LFNIWDLLIYSYYYRRRLEWKDKIKGWILYRINLFYFVCAVSDKVHSAKRWISWFIERARVKVTRILGGDNK